MHNTKYSYHIKSVFIIIYLFRSAKLTYLMVCIICLFNQVSLACIAEDENSREITGGGQAREEDHAGLSRWSEKIDGKAGSATGRQMSTKG